MYYSINVYKDTVRLVSSSYFVNIHNFHSTNAKFNRYDTVDIYGLLQIKNKIPVELNKKQKTKNKRIKIYQDILFNMVKDKSIDALSL